MFPSIYYPAYQIFDSRYWLIHDRPGGDPESGAEDYRARMLFHIKENDYFSTLATILRFYEEYIQSAVSTDSKMRELELQAIKNIIQELLYLDKNFIIAPKDDNKTIRTF